MAPLKWWLPICLPLQVNYKKGFEHSKAHFHLPLDMVTLVHAKKAQTLASNQDYRHPLPQHTSLAEDLRLRCAKKAHKLQSEVKCPDLSLRTLLLPAQITRQWPSSSFVALGGLFRSGNLNSSLSSLRAPTQSTQ